MRKILAYPLGFSVPESVTDEVKYTEYLNKLLNIVKFTIADDSLIFVGHQSGETVVKLQRPMKKVSTDWDWFEFHMDGSDSENAIFFREFRRRIYNILMNAEELMLKDVESESDIMAVIHSLEIKIVSGAIVLMVCEVTDKELEHE